MAGGGCRWALGVLVFEMVAGAPPFYHEDRVAMFKNICAVRYNMPPYFSKVIFPCSAPKQTCGHVGASLMPMRLQCRICRT